MRKSKALTLTEILVSSIIFASVVAGFLSVIVSTRRLNIRSVQRVQAINVAREVLEDFYDEVRAWDWDSGNLQNNANATDYASDTIGGVTYTVDYQVDASDGIGGDGRGRLVDITVRWTLEP